MVIWQYDPRELNFMRRETFNARIDEFSYLRNETFLRIQKRILKIYGVKSFNDIPEIYLGGAFKELQKYSGAIK